MPPQWWLVWLLLAAPITASPPLHVHLVCHSHDDVGWLKTLDQYAAGLNNSIQHACTNCILDSVVDALLADPLRTFTYAEQAFFWRWWRTRCPARQRDVRTLVEQRRLEFVNGGWCMHDEATAHYVDMVDQTTLGHRFLRDAFGVAPTVGWQLDTFGHSATQGSLLAAGAGFSAVFFGRIGYQELELRRTHSAAEFVWRPSPAVDPTATVFASLTGSFQGNYGPPPGFCWDISCTDEPMQGDPLLGGYNIPRRVEEFVQQARRQANMTRGRHIMLTMGSDFQYECAEGWYRNLDKLIAAVNADGRVQLSYSTPERYVAARLAEGIAWPVRDGDFFPYADGPHAFWTGYFTSRPALKRYVRESSAVLQAVRQMVVIAAAAADLPGPRQSLTVLAEAMAVVQHHDGVSGTSKQHVAFDYAARLAAGRHAARDAAAQALRSLARLPSDAEISFCALVHNASVCAATQSGRPMAVLLWNALAHPRTEIVDLPVVSAGVAITDARGRRVPAQVLPSLPSMTNYGPGAEGAPYAAVFQASIPALGFATYRLSPDTSGTPAASLVGVPPGDDVLLENEFLQLKICGPTGLWCETVDKATNRTLAMSQTYHWYNASAGDHASSQASGAYIFRPTSDIPTPVALTRPSVKVIRGSLVSEVRQEFAPWLSQRIRLTIGAHHAEITYTVGPIPVADSCGKEIVVRYSAAIRSEGRCLTDSNGREMVPRRVDHRDAWPRNQTEAVAGNYYPVTTAISIEDAAWRLTVLTDAAQGGTGLLKGSEGEGVVELMVHRRLLNDDGRGVGEPLNETETVTPYDGPHPAEFGQHQGPGLVTRGQHWVVVAPTAAIGDAATHWRSLQDRLYQPPWPAFTPSVPPVAARSLLLRPLPVNVQVMTLESLGPRVTLLRLAHQFGPGEHPTGSRPAEVDLRTLLADQVVTSATETSLTANQPRKGMRRAAWQTHGAATPAAPPRPPPAPFEFGRNSTVTLRPLEIRTFLLRLQ